MKENTAEQRISNFTKRYKRYSNSAVDDIKDEFSVSERLFFSQLTTDVVQQLYHKVYKRVSDAAIYSTPAIVLRKCG